MSVKKTIPFYEDPQQLRDKIQTALKFYELPEEVDLAVLEQWVSETASPVVFIAKVFQEAHFGSEVEAEKLLDLLIRLWNVTPRKELNGLSPVEKARGGEGVK